MEAILASALFLILMLSISLVGYRLYTRPGRFYRRLGETAPVEVFDAPKDPGQQKKWALRIAAQIGEKVPISPQDATTARRYLIAAGYRSDTAVKVFYGIKIVLAVCLVAFAFTVREKVSAQPVLRVVFVVAAALGGYFGPNLLLERIIEKRHTRLRLALPDALDLMVVCMEAGLGLDQAVLNVSRELRTTHQDISDELGLVMLEMRAGKRRADALKNLADRTGEPELRKLVATLVQADRFGTSLSESLRTHSDFMRVRRRQDAEERAAKVGVKLVFPIFFFLLPSMLVVAVGPGVLALFKQLIPMMRGAGN